MVEHRRPCSLARSRYGGASDSSTTAGTAVRVCRSVVVSLGGLCVCLWKEIALGMWSSSFCSPSARWSMPVRRLIFAMLLAACDRRGRTQRESTDAALYQGKVPQREVYQGGVHKEELEGPHAVALEVPACGGLASR